MGKNKYKIIKIKQTSMIKTEKMYKMFEFLKTMEEKKSRK